MQSSVIAGIALLALSTTAAYAGEGNGDPFPGPNAAVTTKMNMAGVTSSSDDPFHYYATGSATRTGDFKMNSNNPDNPFPFSAPGQIVAQPAPTVGPGSTAPTVTARHVNPALPNHG